MRTKSKGTHSLTSGRAGNRCLLAIFAILVAAGSTFAMSPAVFLVGHEAQPSMPLRDAVEMLGYDANEFNVEQFASVATDKADYQPGDVVHISGAGWQPGETVDLHIVSSCGCENLHYYATADGNGDISNSEFLITEAHINISFELTATGLTSGLVATTSFTDSALTYSPGTKSLTVAAGSAISFTQDVTTLNNNAAFTATLKIAGTGANPIPTSWAAAVPSSLSFVANTAQTKSWLVTFTVPAGASAGTYTANIKADPPGGVGEGSGTAVTLTVTSGPTAVCKGTYEVAAGEDCMADVDPIQVDNGSHGAGEPAGSGISNYSLTPAGPFPLGSTAVTLTVTDSVTGQTATCNSTIVVLDQDYPVVTDPENIVESAPEDACSKTIEFTASVQDCSAYTVKYFIGTNEITFPRAFPVGTTTVRIEAVDTLNQAAPPVEFDVTINDTTDPVLDVPSLPDVTGECSATITTTPTATDNCGGSIAGTTTDSLTRNTQGTSVVTWHFVDAAGNEVTQTQNIVVDDVTAPVPDLPSLPDATGECSATISAAPTANDNCGGTITGTTTDPLTRSTQGTSTVTWTFDDGNGNTSMQTQNIVVDDVTAPVPNMALLPDATGECSATIAAPPTASDNCGGTITGTTTDPLTRSTQGTSTVTWTFDDGNGNTSTQTQNIVVDDVTAPVPDLASLPTVTGQCDAAIAAPPMATDNCVGAITGTTSDPTSFSEQGIYTVTWTYDDGNGNTSTQTQTVIVDDTEAPVPNVASLQTVTGQCDASIAAAPTAIDNCEGTVTGTTSDPTSYSEQGSYTVTWTYDDGNGNASTQTQTVIVDDTEAPVPNAASLPDATGECSATISAAPTASDNCGGTITGTTTDSLTRSSQGTSTVTWTFDDGNGNTSTQTQNIVVDDITAPEVPALPDVTGECSATATTPTATDNCGGPVIVTTSNPLSYSTQGTHVIQWQFDDGNGNVSYGSQNVIVDDVTAPVAPTLPDVTGQCLATIPMAPVAPDNCAGPITGTTTDSLTRTTQGTSVVTWTFDDGNGNVSTTTQNIVVQDTIDPVIVLNNPGLTTVPLNGIWVEPGATVSDNCGISGGVTITGTVSTSPINAMSSVTYAATDDAGNTTVMTRVVKVVFASNSGILPPINPNLPGPPYNGLFGNSVFKQKSTVPAKFRVFDGNGVSIGTPGTVAAFVLYQWLSGTTVSEVNEPVVSTTPDTQFRWDATDQQWIFNINTKNLVAGRTYIYKITLADGSVIYFGFGLK